MADKFSEIKSSSLSLGTPKTLKTVEKFSSSIQGHSLAASKGPKMAGASPLLQSQSQGSSPAASETMKAGDEFFSIQSSSPATPEMMFWRIVGHETFSRASIYELTVLSENRQLKANDVLGRAFDVVIGFFDDGGARHERHCQGHAVRFTRIGQAGRYFEYRIVLRSWFWLLTKRTNSRILQDQTVLQIMDAVLDDSPIKSVKKTQPNGVIGTHTPRHYCVQHQESDYRYLSRLLEDEGIYYWFDPHDAPDTMRLSDASNVPHTTLPVNSTLQYAFESFSEARRDRILRWIESRQFDSGKYASRDVHYEHVKTMLSIDASFPQDHELADLQVFEYAGGYLTDGQSKDLRPVRMEELESHYQLHWALTHWPDVAVGRTFTYQGDPDGTRDGDYLIAACTFVATHPGYEGLPEKEPSRLPITAVLREALADDAINAQRLDTFLCLLDGTPELDTGIRDNSAFLITALPAATAFRPPRLTPRVTMPGPQNAIVVGPEGEELHVDEMGRVKVQFHWDRYGQYDQNSTCWIRVTQPWAGKGWGGYFIPRIGQEVLVDFVNGDPDRPIIVGRLYNDDQPIPYSSPTQSGFKTRSTPGGNPATCNEIMFEDAKGNEALNIHAERNMNSSVELDDAASVGRDRTKSIGNNETTQVGNNRTESVGSNETISIGADRSETVGGNETISIGANRSETVTGNETISIGADRSETVTGNETISIGVDRTETVASNETISIGADRTVNVGANETISVGATQKVTVGAAQTVTVGASQTMTVAASQLFNVSSGQLFNVTGGQTFLVVGGQAFTVTGNQVFTVIGQAQYAATGSIKIIAGPTLSLICGGSSIILDSSGVITIQGTTVNVVASSEHNVTASTIKSSASGTHSVEGAVVMLNC